MMHLFKLKHKKEAKSHLNLLKIRLFYSLFAVNIKKSLKTVYCCLAKRSATID